MIANIKFLKRYCKDYTQIENYAEAVKSQLRYDCHHKREIIENKSKKDLIAENLYYDRPPEELVFLEHREHMRLHKEGEKNPQFGKNLSAETRQKMSNAKKNMSEETKQKISAAMKGKHFSQDTRKKMSDAKKGKHWHLENEKRVYTE